MSALRSPRTSIRPISSLICVALLALGCSATALLGQDSPPHRPLDRETIERLRNEIQRVVNQRLEAERREIMEEIERRFAGVHAGERREPWTPHEAAERIEHLEREADDMRTTIRALRHQVDELRRALGEAHGRTVVPPVEPAELEGPATPKALLGLRYEPLVESEAKRLGLAAGQGLEVNAIVRGSPAESLGLRAGDVVTRFDDEPASVSTFEDRMAEKKPGDTVFLTWIRRDGESRLETQGQTKLVDRAGFAEAIADLDAGASEPKQATDAGDGAGEAKGPPMEEPVVLGIRVKEEPSFELVVVSVSAGGNAAEAGLVPNDVLVKVDGRRVRTIEGIEDVLRFLAPGDETTIYYRRGDDEYEARLKLGGGDTAPKLISVTAVKGGEPPLGRDRSAPRAAPPAGSPPAMLGVDVSVRAGSLHVESVVDGSAAEAMQLEAGDILVEANGVRLAEREDLRRVIASLRPGDPIRIRIQRGGAERVLEGTVGAAAPDLAPARR